MSAAKVTDTRLIALNYLKGWFACDLVSSLPLTLLVSQQRGRPTWCELLKLLRATKPLRWLHANHNQTRIEELLIGIRSYNRFFMLGGLVLALFMVSHLIACAWRWAATFSSDGCDVTKTGSTSWILSYGDGHEWRTELSEYDMACTWLTSEQYLASL